MVVEILEDDSLRPGQSRVVESRTLNDEQARNFVIRAGAGNDIVNAATAGPASVISAGSGRDTVRINNNERRRVHSAERVYRIH